MATKEERDLQAIDTAEYMLGTFLVSTYQHLEDLKGVKGLTQGDLLWHQVYDTGIWFARWLSAQERNLGLGRPTVTHDEVREGNEWLNRLRAAHTEACQPQ